MKTNKRGLLTITAMGIFLLFSSGCSSPGQKVEKAKEGLEEAKEDLLKAQTDSIADFELFKKEAEEQMAANDDVIAAFKRRSTQKGKVRAGDMKIINELEQRNVNIRKKIADYTDADKNNWTSFKAEVRHDLEGLGSALKDVTVKNSK